MAADRSERSVVDVFLVDDHAIVRRGLEAYINSVPGLRVSGQAADGLQAVDQVRQRHALGQTLPDVVLMDLQMPRMTGVEAIQALVGTYPEVKIVVLTSFGEAERVQAALAAGAAGYLLKDADADEIAAAIHAAVSGEVHIDSAVTGHLTRRMAGPQVGLRSLTPREREILLLVAEGGSNRDIAERLVISERTARTHVSNVLSKLELSSRTQAVLLAIREGLVPPPS